MTFTKISIASALLASVLLGGAVAAFAEPNATSTRPGMMPRLEGGHPALAPAPSREQIPASTTFRDGGMGPRGINGVNASTSDKMMRSATSSRSQLMFGKSEEVARGKADQEISARTASLTKLIDRVNAMEYISSTTKAAIIASITAEITALSSRKDAIDTETATSTLKTDIQSITKDYRVYALVEPQATIAALADRASGAADLLAALSAKLAIRVASSTNSVTLYPLVTEMQAKVTDAKSLAAAALAETASLVPDNGNATVAAANTAALKDARAKLTTAQAELKTAQQDANNIINGLRGKTIPRPELNHTEGATSTRGNR